VIYDCGISNAQNVSFGGDILMSDNWVVLAWKIKQDGKKSLLFKITGTDSHYIPVKMSTQLPLAYILFVVETEIGRIPVFDARFIQYPQYCVLHPQRPKLLRKLTAKGKTLKTPKQTCVVKPYQWLTDRYDVTEIIPVSNCAPSTFASTE
jgi:hypothetical protein